jgi:hypothetical protein
MRFFSGINCNGLTPFRLASSGLLPAFQSSDVAGCGGSGAWDATCGEDLGGNIDADPLFVFFPDEPPYPYEPADLRLQAGSPCLDAGDNSLLPPDVAELDSDGDTEEPLPLDLAGAPRTVDGNSDSTVIVDVGAYEYQL